MTWVGVVVVAAARVNCGSGKAVGACLVLATGGPTNGTPVEPLVLLLLSCCMLVTADTGVVTIIVAIALANADAVATVTATEAGTGCCGSIVFSAAGAGSAAA